jgi:hypothetical protein
METSTLDEVPYRGRGMGLLGILWRKDGIQCKEEIHKYKQN